MSLRAELTAEVAAAFDTDLADAVSQFEGKRVIGTGPPDPITETRPEIIETYAGRGVFSGYRQSLVDGVLIMATDKRLTALQAEVTDTPKMGDVINGMRVLDVAQDPVAATWRLHLREV